MEFLFKKMLRDIRSNWTQFFSVFLMATISVLIFSGMASVWTGLNSQVSAFADDSNMADIWVKAVGITDDDINKINAVNGVDEAIRCMSLSLSESNGNGEIQVNTVDGTDISNGHTLVPQDENAVSLIIFTSGTSGRHKGVMLSQRNIISSAMIGVEKVGKGLLYPCDRSIPVLPLFHMFGITASIIAPMSLGMTLYIIDEMKYVIKSLSSIKPKILFAVPMIIKTMLNRALLLEKKGLSPQKIKDEFFGGLTAVVSGGAALHPELIEQYERFGIQLLNGYGITECSPIVTASSYNDFEKGAVGRVNDLCCAEVKIIDGTVHVSGDIVMQGYAQGRIYPC
ncbi:MAG: AMP-binding protein [Ruminococcus sp.]|nr:AMP-binding protein [Ruminococcus sp.]